MPNLSAHAAGMPMSPIREMVVLADTIEGAIRLHAGEPDFNTPEPIIRAAQRALDEGWTKYTGSQGLLALRKALAEYDTPKLGFAPDPAREICITMGGTHSLYLAYLAVLSAGDEVLVPDPGWPTYSIALRLAGGVPAPYLLDPRNGFRVDRESVLAALTPRTRALLINTPGNPTGTVLGADDLTFFADLARERDLWVIADEVYEKILFDGRQHRSIVTWPGMRERTVVAGSFSKTFAMTGWRLGHVVGPPRVIETVVKLQGAVNTCPQAAAQMAGIAAAHLPAEVVTNMVREFQARRDVFVQEAAQIPGIRCQPPGGTFFIFADCSSYGVDDRELAKQLVNQAKVTSVPGMGFGAMGAGFLRFSIVRSPDEIRLGLSKVREVLAKL